MQTRLCLPIHSSARHWKYREIMPLIDIILLLIKIHIEFI